MKKLHVISHTHWDREWYLTFQQFRLKLVRLIDKLLDILDEDPEFKYFMLDGQTIVLDDYLHMRPEKETLLREHIQNGRIMIGPWHILPDMFLVSPEAHIRNLLEGARTAQNFGPTMPVGYIPDSFGHPGQTPQILKGFGLNVASLWRGVDGDQPTEMWWESPDGSRVLLAYLRDSYSNGANLPVSNSELFAQAISIAGESLAAKSAVDDHLIMLGTDHMEMSPFTSRAIGYANEHLGDKEVVHSTFPGYISAITEQIERLEQTIPTVHGELRACDHSHLLPGVLSTRMWIKQRNHSSQILLEKWVEPFSVFAEHIVGNKEENVRWDEKDAQDVASNRLQNVAPIIRQAWRLLMENHPHDSICGCSIDQVHDEMEVRFDQVDQIGEELTQQSLHAIAAAVDTKKDDVFSSIVLFNPQGFENKGVVEVDLKLPEDIKAFEILDDDGNAIPYEFIGSSNEEFANVLLPESALRDTIGAISEGWVAGSAILRVNVTRKDHIVTIDTLLDEKRTPNIDDWRKAEELIAKYEVDPTVTHYHVIAYSPTSSKVRIDTPLVPALGWRTLWLKDVSSPVTDNTTEVSPLLKPLLPLAMKFAQSEFGMKVIGRLEARGGSKLPFLIENEFFKVEAFRQEGTFTVCDKKTGVTYEGLNHFVDGSDTGDEYNYAPLAEDKFYSPKVTGIKAFPDQLKPSLEVAYVLKAPKKLAVTRKRRSNEVATIPILSRISLTPGVPRIEIQTEIDNQAEDHRLRVHFRIPFAVTQAAHDGHFEVVNRKLGVPESDETWVEEPRPEVPQRAFTDVSNGSYGLMIANRGLPEVEVIDLKEIDETEIALTLVRSVGVLSRDDLSVRQGHAGPAFDTPGGQVLGRGVYEYAIIPHAGDWRKAYQQAYAYETSLRAIEVDLHDGEIADIGSFVSHSPVEFVISAVKESEDGNGWLVRGYNISSETIQVDLKPLRIFSTARCIDLKEETITALKIKDDGSVSVPVAGHQIVGILFSP